MFALRMEHFGNQHVDHSPSSLCFNCKTHVGVFIASDSMVLTRTLQGRWKARTPWLAHFVRTANDFVFELAASQPLCTEYDGWWVAHTPRTQNQWSDIVAKHAKAIFFVLGCFGRTVQSPFRLGAPSRRPLPSRGSCRWTGVPPLSPRTAGGPAERRALCGFRGRGAGGQLPL